MLEARAGASAGHIWCKKNTKVGKESNVEVQPSGRVKILMGEGWVSRGRGGNHRGNTSNL